MLGTIPKSCLLFLDAEAAPCVLVFADCEEPVTHFDSAFFADEDFLCAHRGSDLGC